MLAVLFALLVLGLLTARGVSDVPALLVLGWGLLGAAALGLPVVQPLVRRQRWLPGALGLAVYACVAPSAMDMLRTTLWMGSMTAAGYWLRDEPLSLRDIVLLLVMALPVSLGLVPMHQILVGTPAQLAAAPFAAIPLAVALFVARPLEADFSTVPPRTALVAVAAGAAFAVLVLPAALVSGVARFGVRGAPLDLLWTVAYMFFLPALLEEFFFRGVLQTLAIRRFGEQKGWIGVSVLFGLVHMRGLMICLLATLAGVLYGYIYRRSGSLLACTLTHLVIDVTWVFFFSG